MIQFPKFDRHLLILLFTQAIAGSTVPVLLLVSGFLGAELAPDPKISTLPIALVVLGIAVASTPASALMAKFGRKKGHILGLVLTQLGVAVAAYALWKRNFEIYCAANLICGTGAAFNNQVRFTAAEGSQNQKALVHSWVLMASLFAAILGPWIAAFGHELLSVGEYVGSMAMIGGALFVTMLALFALPERHLTAPGTSPVGISRAEVLRQGKFWLAAGCGIASYATMTLLMSATPMQMHHVEHFTHGETAHTIQSHIVAMYLPSLFSGILITKFGIHRLIYLGIVLFLACIGLTYFNHEFHHYWWALVLLGVGWNFLFLAGSTWVSLAYTGPERFLAQGANDTLVFGIQAAASLAAGWLLFSVGWQVLVLMPVPLLLALAVYAARAKKVV